MCEWLLWENSAGPGGNKNIDNDINNNEMKKNSATLRNGLTKSGQIQSSLMC